MERMHEYRYTWPEVDLGHSGHWKSLPEQRARMMHMPEDEEELQKDSRWPAFFPSPISLVTACDGDRAVLEKVVGASIVNRFPYVVALSFCNRALSSRHYVRSEFMSVLESGGCAAIQYLPVGPALDRVLASIAEVPNEHCSKRLERVATATRKGVTNAAPIFEDAYMVYEARLVRPGKDFEGQTIYERPWVDVGSHRMYFLEITAIQLRSDIACGSSQIHWRSLPSWSPKFGTKPADLRNDVGTSSDRYTKGYTPHYTFPSSGTIGFEADEVIGEMAIKRLPPLPQDQVEVDNDRARWPCFFPSSAGLITTWTDEGLPNLMPCGSTTVVSRHPMIIAPCVSYAAINQRYAPRASLSLIRKRGKFGCGVPYINDAVIDAIKYAGNTSISVDRDKVAHAGLEVRPHPWAPVLSAMPIHFDCEVIGEIRLGTHIMFLGEVRRIQVREDVNPENALEWYPWADIREAQPRSASAH